MEEPATGTNGETGRSVPEEGPLVSLSFQKNTRQLHKYLDGEPKALGVTQMTISLLQMTLCYPSYIMDNQYEQHLLKNGVVSVVMLIAGALAVAARNLHPPTLRSCLALQILGCILAVVSMLSSLVTDTIFMRRYCWYEHEFYNETESTSGMLQHNCEKLMLSLEFYNAAWFVIDVSLIAICATLAAYCCKSVECCCPMAPVTVLMVRGEE